MEFIQIIAFFWSTTVSAGVGSKAPFQERHLELISDLQGARTGATGHRHVLKVKDYQGLSGAEV